MNPNVEQLAIPYQRAMTFLSYIRGPLVDDWVDEQARWLDEQIANGVLHNENNLWDTIHTRFVQAYTDTAEQTKARKALPNLSMKGEDIDSYIAQFQNLAAKAHYNLDDPITLNMFQDGLPNALVINAVRFQHPINWEQWKDAARLQQAEYLLLKERLGKGGKPRKRAYLAQLPTKGHARSYIYNKHCHALHFHDCRCTNSRRHFCHRTI